MVELPAYEQMTDFLCSLAFHFLHDRTNGRAYATVSSVCNVMYCG